jgi:hypothetical protein
VVANVRDIVLWPFLAVAIGAGIGGFGVTRGQRWRTRRVLDLELDRAKTEYERRAESSPIGPPTGVASAEALSGLKEEVNQAKSSEELDELTTRVRGARDSMRTWVAIDVAARSLVGAGPTPIDAPEVRKDAEAAFDVTKWIPDDDAAAAKLATRLRRQEAIVRAFDRAYKRWPAAAIKAYGKADGASADDAKTAELIAELERVEEPGPAIVILPVEEQEAQADAIIAAFQDRRDIASLGDLLGDRVGPETPLLRVTPEQRERPIRRWDRTLGLVTFAATVLLFVLEVYDENFGTWEDYGKAFAAGLAGQVGGAALWNLFPSLRSYRVPVAKAK